MTTDIKMPKDAEAPIDDEPAVNLEKSTVERQRAHDPATGEDEAGQDKKPKKSKPTKKELTAKLTALEAELAAEKTANRTRKRTSPIRTRIAITAGIAVVIAAATAGVLEKREADRLAENAGTRAAVSHRAAEFSQALLSYDHTNMAATRSQVLGLSTGDFAKTYTTAFGSGLETLVTKLKATAKATVRDVYVTESTTSEAKAIAVVDSKVISAAGTKNLTGSYVQMELIKEKGIWKVRAASAIGSDRDTTTPGTPDAKSKPGTGPSDGQKN